MTDRETTSLLFRTMILMLAGVALSMALGGLVTWPLSPGLPRLAFSTLATALGLAATGVVAWRYTRPLAGDTRRTGMIAVLAFVAINEREWLGLFPLESHHWIISAQFALTCVAFIGAMLVFKWLQPLDEREAAHDTASQGEVRP